MRKTITIDPITRISGFLEIRAEVNQNTIVDANASGLLYRGFEKMLKGRPPLDAIYFTERIYGICSTAHGMASSLALENALQIKPDDNDDYIRDIMHGFEFIQNHIRHFYLLTLPSYVRISSIPVVAEQEYSDFRLPDHVIREIEKHYITAIEMSRLAHEGLAVLGGKAPHSHGIFVGGTTLTVDAYKLAKVKSILTQIEDFVKTVMKEDAAVIADYYGDYFEMGISYPYFMSFGVFSQYQDPEITYLKPAIMIDGRREALNANAITEQIHYAWYQNEEATQEVDLSKPDAYTFIKAPRYLGLPMEVGPLARLLISRDYKGGHSCMDRTIARVMETEKILGIMKRMLDRVTIIPNHQRAYTIPDSAKGEGLVDTTRGALGHWVQIENKVIHRYNIITPTVWNLSPKDIHGVHGVVERALLETNIQDIKEPVEIGRIVRSFDPCVSCATHLVGTDGDMKIIEVMV